jgi:SnoaL-like domain
MQQLNPSNGELGLLQANLVRVFNERSAERRLQALHELYTPDAVLYEPQNLVTGYTAISATVGALLAGLPPGFAFTATGPAVGHHGLWCLRWQAGPPDGSVAITGTDVAQVQDGRIKTLYVLLDPTE